jgi:tripeptide aminopeptidase
MDTVPICVGSDPVVEGDRVSSRGETGLGADNRAGCAAIVTGAVERLRSGGEVLPPAKLLLTVQEEVGLKGASNLDVGQLGRVDRAVNFDGGAVEKVTTGAIGGERMSIRVLGVPAHAGAAPEKGASAVVTAARAIADLSRDGWLGLVQKGDRTGTANIGVIRGGEATNVVTPEVTLKAEARSHQAGFRREIVQRIREAFDRAAAEVCNDEGAAARCEFESRVDYEAFRLAEGDPSVAALETVLRQLGRTPLRQVANGGLDANWLNQHGVAAVTAGCGQMNIHTAEEQLSIPDYLDACRIAAQLLGPHSSR